MKEMKAFEKIIGYEDVKAELYRICDLMKNPDKYRRLGVATPRGLLLSGDPGVGKTMMAKAVIAESGRKDITVRKDKPNGDFVNLIRDTFEKAKKNVPSIVFLDDMDKFANEDTEHRDAEEYVTVQACIDECKDFEVFVIATVNCKYNLPDSLLRAGRFDKCIEVLPPEGEDAVKIIDYYLRQKKCLGDIDARVIAKLMSGNSCAELETVINEAGIYAAYADREFIEQEDIIKACMRLMFDAPESCEGLTDEVAEALAVHEAGHITVAEILDPGSVNLVSICRHSGGSEGITSVSKPAGYLFSKELMEHEVIRLLAGKAATEIILGVTDVGCNSDLNHAFRLVAKFVDDLCALGFDSFGFREESDYMRETRDRRVANELEKYYQEAKRMIVENRRLFEHFKKYLLAKKTLTYSDIEMIREHLSAS